MGRVVEIPFPPKRIISLVPSQTELLFHLGLNNEVLGITKFCVHPREWFQSKNKIGGTKHLHLDKIRALQPDLIIANKEENEQQQIETLMHEFPVWLSDIKTLDDALDMILQIGTITGKEAVAKNILEEIQLRFQQIKTPTQSLSAMYLIWREPYMTVNRDTFIHDMLLRCGFKNIFAQADSRYPEISVEQIIDAKPELILLSSEPYPFKSTHITQLKSEIRNSKSVIILVDGEMFSWYGSRLLQAPLYFNELIQKTNHA